MAASWQRRWRARHGDFAVPCIVSGRWLEVSQAGSTSLHVGEAITMSVMTEGCDAKPRELRELIVTREDLLRVLTLVERPCH